MPGPPEPASGKREGMGREERCGGKAMRQIWIGVDVAKDRLDVAVRPTGEAFTAANDESGRKALVKRLKKLSPTRVVLEATGGYEYALAYQLMKAEIAVAVVNPR